MREVMFFFFVNFGILLFHIIFIKQVLFSICYNRRQFLVCYLVETGTDSFQNRMRHFFNYQDM